MRHTVCRWGTLLLALALPVSAVIAEPPAQVPAALFPPTSQPSQPEVAAPPLSGAAPEAPPATDAELAGVYVSESGTEIVICRPGDAANWVMSIAEPDAQPFTIVLDGDASSLRPSGLEATVQVGGSPVSVVADGSRLFARGAVDGKNLECLREGGKGRMAVGGSFSSKGPPSPGEMEMSLTLDDLAGRWDAIRQTRYNLGREGLQVSDASDPKAAPRRFTRKNALSENDTKTMEQKLITHAAGLDESKSFAARAKESEVTP